MHESDLYTVETNIPGVRAFKPLPDGFVVERASDEELLRYGFPLRPNRERYQKQYSAWKRFVTSKSKRIIPKLVQTNIHHGPLRRLSETITGPFSVNVNSDNWSGIAIVDNAGKPFASWGSQVSARWAVPRVTCTTSGPGAYNSSQWIGIDGYDSNDVLQAGTEADINCPGQSLPNFAWIEWYPYSAVKIDNIAVNPGDQISVGVWPSNAIPGKGQITVENQTTLQTASFMLDPPPGVSLIGNSVEWIVERPLINGSLTNLANYLTLTMQDCIALHYVTPSGPINNYYPGRADSGIIYDITMIENNHAVSVANVLAIDPNLPNGIVFVDTN